MPNSLFDELSIEYGINRIRRLSNGTCEVRVDDSGGDVAHSACLIQLSLPSPDSADFQLQLINVPWNANLAALVAEWDGSLTGPDFCKVLTLSAQPKSYRQTKQLAKAIRAVTGRGQRYPNSNWKWSSRKAAEALERLAECLLTAHRARRAAAQ